MHRKSIICIQVWILVNTIFIYYMKLISGAVLWYMRFKVERSQHTLLPCMDMHWTCLIFLFLFFIILLVLSRLWLYLLIPLCSDVPSFNVLILCYLFFYLEKEKCHLLHGNLQHTSSLILAFKISLWSCSHRDNEMLRNQHIKMLSIEYLCISFFSVLWCLLLYFIIYIQISYSRVPVQVGSLLHQS